MFQLALPLVGVACLPLISCLIGLACDWLDARAHARELREFEAYQRAAWHALDPQSEATDR